MHHKSVGVGRSAMLTTVLLAWACAYTAGSARMPANINHRRHIAARCQQGMLGDEMEADALAENDDGLMLLQAAAGCLCLTCRGSTAH